MLSQISILLDHSGKTQPGVVLPLLLILFSRVIKRTPLVMTACLHHLCSLKRAEPPLSEPSSPE